MQSRVFPLAPRVMTGLGLAALAFAILELLLFGVVGVKRKQDGWSDSVYYYSAGRTWLARQNPYDPATIRAHADGKLDNTVARLYYPPQVAPLFMFLGLFSYPVAVLLLKLINIAAMAGVCVIAVRSVRPAPTTPGPPGAPASIPWLLPAILMGDPWFIDMLWGGGIVPIVSLCMIAGWMQAERGRDVAAGVLMGIATMKPQFAALPILWMACERRWKVVALAGATAVVLMAYPLAVQGPITVMKSWIGNVRLYSEEWCNLPGWPHVMGIAHLLFAFGVTLPDLKFLAVLLTIALWLVRRKFRREDILAILTTMSLSLVASHDYDIVVLAPLLIAYWRHLADRPREAAVALLLALVLIFPEPIAAKLPLPGMAQRCTIATLILLGWMLWLSSRRTAQADAPKGVQVEPAA